MTELAFPICDQLAKAFIEACRTGTIAIPGRNASFWAAKRGAGALPPVLTGEPEEARGKSSVASIAVSNAWTYNLNNAEHMH